MTAIIERPRIWKNNREVKVAPWKFPRAKTWGISPAGDLTLYSKRGNLIISLSAGNWEKVRRG